MKYINIWKVVSINYWFVNHFNICNDWNIIANYSPNKSDNTAYKVS